MERTKKATAEQSFEGFPRSAGAIEKVETSAPAERVRINKAYKMYIGGAFVRSESGRYFQVKGNEAGADPEAVNIPLGSRKDVRDAVLAAKGASEKWAARTAYNRGQILYRLAEMMESRAPELLESLVRSGLSDADAARELAVSIDRVVYYAGFTDKISALFASHNPVSGPHFGFTLPEPVGVIGVVAPSTPSLLGLVSTTLPVIAGGNVVIALASETDPRTALVFAECLATSDLPAAVLNILTGNASEMAPHLVKHREVQGIDATVDDEKLRTEIEQLSADSVKRTKVRANMTLGAWLEHPTGQGLTWMERFIEAKTIWHPMSV
jgi:acyl-CoA reductase-like NAD-dependent aldehyde dehydrogenase